MKPFLVLQLRPEDATSDSEFEALLRYGGLGSNEVVRVRLDQEPFPKPDLNRLAAILVGGSPFELSTPSPTRAIYRRASKRALPI